MSDLLDNVLPYIKPKLPPDADGKVFEVSGPDEPIIEDLQNGLLALYLLDRGDVFDYVQRRHLEQSGVSMTDLHSQALTNLRRLASDRLRLQTCGSTFALFLDGNFEVSLILLDELWDETLAAHAKEKIIIALPARDVLAFSGSVSPQGVSELRALIMRVLPTQDHPISSDLYIRNGKKWDVWQQGKQ